MYTYIDDVHDYGASASEWFKCMGLGVNDLLLLSLANSTLIGSRFGKRLIQCQIPNSNLKLDPLRFP